MRTLTASVFARPWFRRRRVGIGWRPVSWQGGVTTSVALALTIGVFALMHGSADRFPIVILIVALYAVVALLTGGARTDSATPTVVVAAPAPPEAARRRIDEPRPLPHFPVPRRELVPETGAEPVLVVEHLTKRFGERVAVDDV